MTRLVRFGLLGGWPLLASGALVFGCSIDDRAIPAVAQGGTGLELDASGGGASGSALPNGGSAGSDSGSPGAGGLAGALGTPADRGVSGADGTAGSGDAGTGSLPACVPSVASFRILDSLSVNVARAVSADGAFVVGESETTNGTRAFRWSAATGIQNLGTLPGGSATRATAVSADGSVVVGYGASADGDRAFRWSEATGMQDLGVLAEATDSRASAVSGDGSIVAGSSGTAQQTSAFRWTGLTGMQALGAGTATGLSADGSVIVGYGTGVRSIDDEDAFRWTAAAGRQDLGAAVEQAATWPSAISSDGEVIVGYRLDDNRNYRAFRWLESDGASNLPVLPADTVSVADCYGYATNADGSVVVGADDNGTSSSVLDAFIWTALLGTVRVIDLMPEGSVPAGWLLRSANGVSADGLTVVGEARESTFGPSHGWVAELARDCP